MAEMVPRAPGISGMYAPINGTMADFGVSVKGIMQGTRGIKRPASSMTGPLSAQAGIRLASSNTYDQRTTKTVPYQYHVTGKNVPGVDYHAHGLPIFFRDSAKYPNTAGYPKTSGGLVEPTIAVGGLYGHPYKTSLQAFSLQHLNFVLASAEADTLPGAGAYPKASKVLEGFVYGGIGRTQQGGVSADWNEGKEFSNAKQVNVTKWGSAESVAFWSHNPQPGDQLWFIGKRHDANDLESKKELEFNINPATSAARAPAPRDDPCRYPFQFKAWSGRNGPRLADLMYDDPNTGELCVGASIYVGKFDYSVEAGQTRAYERAVTNTRVAMDTGLIRLTAWAGGIRFNL